MGLENYIRKKLKEKDILLMTHIVLGYPSITESLEIIKIMVQAGVDIMELQIPFSEPIADGPVILRANHEALKAEVTVRDCLDAARQAAASFDIPFLIMTYYNIPFTYGIERFSAALKERGLQGAIIADLPPEEGGNYIRAMENRDLAPVFIFSPKTPNSRMQFIASQSRGFVYCGARKGVTGARSDFSGEMAIYLERCRRATPLPLAVGFGLQTKEDIHFLKGKAEIAVIGTRTLQVMEEHGLDAIGPFITGLRE